MTVTLDVPQGLEAPHFLCSINIMLNFQKEFPKAVKMMSQKV
jgi:hypothetical protein